MIPIFEQGQGKGIGHNIDSFSKRFEELCQEHISQGKARAFAFLFYDFGDKDFRKIIKDLGVFAQLDRLAGRDLSIFYLHTGSRDTIDRFNSEFLSRLKLKDVTLPCIVFFKIKERQISDLAAVHLESSGLIHGFKELHDAISKYISESPIVYPKESKYWRWTKSSAKFILAETFRAFLDAILKGHSTPDPH